MLHPTKLKGPIDLIGVIIISRRLCFYLVSDVRNLEDHYVLYYLRGLRTVCNRIILIIDADDSFRTNIFRTRA